MSILKIKDKDGNWVEIPSLNVSVNRKSVRAAIPSLVECIEDSDSPFLALDGRPIPIGRIASGSYVGNGTFGKDNPVTLTFDFEPKMVFVSATTTINRGQPDNYGVLKTDTKIFFNGVNAIESDSGINYDRLDVIWGSNSLSFYFAKDIDSEAYNEARFQLNASGETYVYYAIG